MIHSITNFASLFCKNNATKKDDEREEYTKQGSANFGEILANSCCSSEELTQVYGEVFLQKKVSVSTVNCKNVASVALLATLTLTQMAIYFASTSV